MDFNTNIVIPTKFKFYNNITAAKVCLYIFWTLLLVGKGMGYASYHPIFRKIVWVGMIFAAAKLLLTNWNEKELATCIALNLVGACVWLFSNETKILLTTIAITSLKGIDIKTLFKWSFWVKASMFVTRTSMAMLGLITTEVKYRWSDGEAIGVRYGLGYGNPNTTHYTLFVIYALCVIVYKEKLKF